MHILIFFLVLLIHLNKLIFILIQMSQTDLCNIKPIAEYSTQDNVIALSFILLIQLWMNYVSITVYLDYFSHCH